MLTHWQPITSIILKVMRISLSLFECNSVRNKKLFLNFLFHLCNLHQILNILKEKNIVISNVLLKLQTVKDLVRSLSKKHRFRTSFNSQHVKGSQTFAKSAWEHFYHTFSLLWGEIISKIFPLLKVKIIVVFVNTLTTVYKYPVPAC